MFNLIFNILECFSITIGFYYIYCLNSKYKNLLKNIEKYKNDYYNLKIKNNNLENNIKDYNNNIYNELKKFVTFNNFDSFNQKFIQLKDLLNKNIISIENKYDYLNSQLFDLNKDFDNLKKINFNNFDYNNLNILKNDIFNKIKDFNIFNTNLQNSQNDINILKTNFDNKDTEINNINTKFNDIYHKLHNNNDDINILKTNFDNKDTEINNINTKFNDIYHKLQDKSDINKKIMNKISNEINTKINNKLNNKFSDLYNQIHYIKYELNTYLDKTYMLVSFDSKTNIPIYVLRKNELDQVQIRQELADYWNFNNMINYNYN